MIIILTGATYDRDGYEFWSGSENVTEQLQDMMDKAKAEHLEAERASEAATVKWCEAHSR